jgi:hypothetical protein
MSMKPFRILIALCAALIAVLPVAAQENNPPANQSDQYYVTVSIEKIYPYRLGYVVQYRKGISGYARAYLPLEWFTGADGRGELVSMGTGSNWPSLTVFYKNGEFDHARLYVRRSKSHETWGTIPQGTNLDPLFEGVTGVTLEFQ